MFLPSTSNQPYSVNQEMLLTQYLNGDITFDQYQIQLMQYEENPKPQQKGEKKSKRQLRQELLSSETSDLLEQVTEALGGRQTALEESDNSDESEFYDDQRDKDYVPPEKIKKFNEKRGRIGRKKKEVSFESEFDDELTISELGDEQPKMRYNRPLRQLDGAQQSLLGHANLTHAKGESQAAIEMILQIIKEVPRNPEPYQHLAAIYEDLGDSEKQLQFALLAANLDYKTPGHIWGLLGVQCEQFDKTGQALTCYSKAIRLEPTEWHHYEGKIRICEGTHNKKMANVTRLAAVNALQKCYDLAKFAELVKKTAQSLREEENSKGAAVCYQRLLEKARYFDCVHQFMNDLHVLIILLFESQQTLEVAKTIFTFVPELLAFDENGENVVKVEMDMESDNIRFDFKDPFPPVLIAKYNIPDCMPFSLIAQLIISWLKSSRLDLAKCLIERVENVQNVSGNEDYYLDVTQCLVDVFQLEKAEEILRKLIKLPEMENSPKAWLQYAEVKEALGDPEMACIAFTRVVKLAPSMVDARISLSLLQHQLGESDKALETLQEQQLDLITRKVPDERLLQRQAMILYENKEYDKFLSSARCLLARYFYEAYQQTNYEKRKQGDNRNRCMCSAALQTLRGTIFEKYVKRIGPLASANKKQLQAQDIHDICFKVCEVLFDRKEYTDMLYVCCYAYNLPIFSSGMTKTFDSLLLIASIWAKKPKLAFEYLRNCPPQTDRQKLWNLHGLVFCCTVDVRFQRYVFRAAQRNPDCESLGMISGNNSLISGTYHHALAEYFDLFQKDSDDPLLNLLIGVTFINIGSKKDISRRHDLCLQGLAFLQRYQKLRGVNCPETYYNIGRAMHQMNIMFAAMHFYQKVLEMDPIEAETKDPITGETVERRTFDLKPIAAYNLALIYKTSNNSLIARSLMEKYCCVE